MLYYLVILSYLSFSFILSLAPFVSFHLISFLFPLIPSSSSFFPYNPHHYRFGDAYCENPQRIRVVEEVRAGIKAIIADFDSLCTEGKATYLLP